MDFTLQKYQEFLKAISCHKAHRIRHDIDQRPMNALRVAELEAEMGVSATYYFRSMHFNTYAHVIKAIVSLGHTAGYHYESLTTCKGDMEAAHKDFCNNLEKLRTIAPIKTACAHGSPRSPWDSLDIWKAYDIHVLGIDYEPMMDTDFATTLYLTDTGRRWDGYRMSVRDKVPQYQEQWIKEGLSFRTTDDIIHAIGNISHPIHKKRLLINTHPQRWMPFGLPWMEDAILQNTKNIVKKIIVSNQ